VRPRLDEDTAWHPITTADLDKWGDGVMGRISKAFFGTPLKLWASVGHWAIWHFNISKFTQKQRPRVRSRVLMPGFAQPVAGMLLHFAAYRPAVTAAAEHLCCTVVVTIAVLWSSGAQSPHWDPRRCT